MKVLQINAYYGYGSTGKIVKDIYEYQKKNGIDGYVAYGISKNECDFFDSHIIKFSNSFVTSMHRLLFFLFGKQWRYSFFKTKRLIRIINKIGPDIIHLHNIHDYYLNYPLLFNYLNRHNIKIIWTFHDCWAFTGHCNYFLSVNCNKWKTECVNCPLLRVGPRTLFFDFSKKNFNIKRTLFNKNITIVTVSNWLKNITGESFLKYNNIETIYNWYDPAIYYPKTSEEKNKLKKKYKLENKTILLGLASVWSQRKGLEDIINLSKKLSKDFVIVLVGKISKNDMNIIKKQNNIFVFNRTNNFSILREYYCLADIFLNLSTQETFGLTTIESLACGTPAIVYDLTACPEILGYNSKCGIIVDYNERRIENIIFGINDILKNLQNYELNIKKNIKKRYNKDVQLSQYINLYKKVLKEKGKMKYDKKNNK